MGEYTDGATEGRGYNDLMTVTATAMALVIGCALAFSCADIARKLLAGWMRPIPILFALSAGMAPFFLVWYGIEGGAGPGSGYWLPGLSSTLINVVANLAFIEALRRSPLSLTVPLLSLTPVFTTLLAIPMLHEMPEPRQWMGIAAVVVGAFWLNLEPGAISLGGAWKGFVSVTWRASERSGPLTKKSGESSTA